MPWLVVASLGWFAAYVWLATGAGNGTIGFDFEGTIWEPALKIRGGESPYPEPTVENVGVGNPAVYPPLLMTLAVPFTVLPYAVGEAIWVALLVGCVPLSLAILNVRDWRCYVVAIPVASVMAGVSWGNATLVFLPLLALVWRWRDRSVRSGAVLGVAIAAKLFLWPLVFWLVGTRRYRAAAVSVVVAIGAVLGPWAAIGFDGLAQYRELLRVAEEVYAVHSYSIATALSAVGFATASAVWVTIGVGLVGAAASFVLGRRDLQPAAFAVAILAAVAGSPIVWEHYYALLLVPIAIVRPRLSPLWLAPLAVYFTHRLPRPRLDASELEPGGSACCRPADVPAASWVFNHAPAGLWPALGTFAVGLSIVIAVAWLSVRRDPEQLAP